MTRTPRKPKAPKGVRQNGNLLTTFASVFNFLGAGPGLRKLTGRSRQSISDWKARQRFPAEFFQLMNDEIEGRGFKASPEFWSQARGQYVVDPITNEVRRIGGEERNG